MNPTEQLLTQIAREHLHIDTLKTRRADSLDFHDVAVWCVRDALEAAFNAGVAHAQKAKHAKKATQANS